MKGHERTIRARSGDERYAWVECECGLSFSRSESADPGWITDLRQAHEDHVRAEEFRAGIRPSATVAPAPVSPLEEARREHMAAVEAHIRARKAVAEADIALSESNRLHSRAWDALAARIEEAEA